MTEPRSTRRALVRSPRDLGRRWTESDRLGLRAAAARADHLPGHPGRRRHRQQDLRADAAAVRGGPDQRHHALHQLARAVRSPPAWRSTTRCSSSSATSRPTRWAWPRRWGSSCSPPAPRASVRPAARADHDAPAVRRHRWHREPTSRSRPSSSRYTKREMAELIAEHTGQTVEQINADSDRDRWFTAAGGPGVRLHRPRRRPRRRPAAPATDPRSDPLRAPRTHGEADDQPFDRASSAARRRPAAATSCPRSSSTPATASRSPTRTTSCSRSASSSSACRSTTRRRTTSWRSCWCWSRTDPDRDITCTSTRPVARSPR